MRFIDVHCHLTAPSIRSQLDQVLSRAQAAGVALMLTQSEGPEDCREALEMMRRHSRVRAFLGQHPDNPDRQQAAEVRELIREHRDEIAGIGEVGLDRWKVKDTEGRAEQIEIFRGFIELAAELELPLSIHSRSAGRVVLEELNRAGAERLRVCLHAFDGKAKYVRHGAEKGYFFSLPTSVIYSRQKQKMAAALPLENLLLETDSPVMAPIKGSTNEPANILVSAQKYAMLNEIPVELVAEQALENSERFLGLSL